MCSATSVLLSPVREVKCSSGKVHLNQIVHNLVNYTFCITLFSGQHDLCLKFNSCETD